MAKWKERYGDDVHHAEYEMQSKMVANGTMQPEEGAPEEDVVNSPNHYTQGIECIDYIEDNMPIEAFIGGLEWNTKKYLHRWRYKSKPLEDLKKAQFYLNRLIKAMEGE